jgi:hypothetical protein
MMAEKPEGLNKCLRDFSEEARGEFIDGNNKADDMTKL